MKRLIATLAILAPAAASAHEVGLHHHHPHIDPALLVAGAVVAGIALFAVWLRGQG